MWALCTCVGQPLPEPLRERGPGCLPFLFGRPGSCTSTESDLVTQALPGCPSSLTVLQEPDHSASCLGLLSVKYMVVPSLNLLFLFCFQFGATGERTPGPFLR